jgi:hypothetical protein
MVVWGEAVSDRFCGQTVAPATRGLASPSEPDPLRLRGRRGRATRERETLQELLQLSPYLRGVDRILLVTSPRRLAVRSGVG